MTCPSASGGRSRRSVSTAVGGCFASLLLIAAFSGCSDDDGGVAGATVDTALFDTGTVVDVGVGDQAEPAETVAGGAGCTGHSAATCVGCYFPRAI